MSVTMIPWVQPDAAVNLTNERKTGMDALVDVAREAMITTLTLMAPLLLAGLLIGMFVGVVQAITNVQDPTISLVPRIMVMLLTLMVCLPWLIGRMVEYSHSMFSHIPFTGGG
jgi:flagellar biosynthetic protein FliQ